MAGAMVELGRPDAASTNPGLAEFLARVGPSVQQQLELMDGAKKAAGSGGGKAKKKVRAPPRVRARHHSRRPQGAPCPRP